MHSVLWLAGTIGVYAADKPTFGESEVAGIKIAIASELLAAIMQGERFGLEECLQRIRSEMNKRFQQLKAEKQLDGATPSRALISFPKTD